MIEWRFILSTIFLSVVLGLLLLLFSKGQAQAEEPPVLKLDIPTDKYQGKSAEWWANKTVHWKKAAMQRARTIRKHRSANHQRLTLGSQGVAEAFLCIKSFEGSWQDDGAPFWGGLQMDRSFQQSYGPEFLRNLGTADHWPPFVQVAVAMRAYYSGRGFAPWPNTRRMCGV